MKNIAATSCAVLMLGSFMLHADPLIHANDTLAICGDSITAQHAYSAFIEDYLLMCQPTEGLKVVQFGWSGEQATGLLARLDTDVFPFKPTLATTCYGMNDGHYGPLTDDVANTYRKAQTDIIEAMKKAGVRTIVLGSPKCVDSYSYHPKTEDAAIYNQTLSSLADIDKEIATREGVVYADVFGTMTEAMKKLKAQYGDQYIVGGGDGIHPDLNGHLVMAYAFLKALGYGGDIATINVDLNSNQVTATPGQEVESCKDGVISLKSTRYPFCFSGSIPDPSTPPNLDPNQTAFILKSVPFNEDLNRYMLTVKGLKSAQAKITWGTQSKVFSADDLAKGINLAANFMDNPFREQFFRVHQAVQIQQKQEQTLVQDFVHDEKSYKMSVPSASEAMDQWVSSGMILHDALYKGAMSLIVPIEHTIKIEPL